MDGKTYHYYSLPEAARTLGDLGKLPMSLKVLLENLLRWEDGSTVTGDDLKALAGWLRERRSDREIQYRPARVLMQTSPGFPRWSTWPPCARPWPRPAATRRRSTHCRRWTWSSTTR
ncbi:hypothetical protein P4112_12675 [Pseudomonas aeruginosa]|nr:hypothetical protein [Pseudomonas aeruginosa]